MYKKGAIVILEAKEDDLPVFVLVEYVLAVDVENYFFIVHVLHTTCFNPHSYAYDDHHPLGLYTCTILDQSLHLVSLKYHVISK